MSPAIILLLAVGWRHTQNKMPRFLRYKKLTKTRAKPGKHKGRWRHGAWKAISSRRKPLGEEAIQVVSLLLLLAPWGFPRWRPLALKEMDGVELSWKWLVPRWLFFPFIWKRVKAFWARPMYKSWVRWGGHQTTGWWTAMDGSWRLEFWSCRCWGISFSAVAVRHCCGYRRGNFCHHRQQFRFCGCP